MENDNNDLEAFKARSEANKPREASVSSDYEARMVEAFVGKPDEPERGFWYANAFSKYNVNGVDSMKWHWSWWAFMGGLFFLLYRKAYAAAGGLFLISLVAGIVPGGGLVIWILSGGFSPYFVYKAYKAKKLEIEAAQSSEEERISTMQMLGGYNQWVVWLAVVINIIVLIAVLMVIATAMGVGSTNSY